jgi:hypothetical protein
MPCVTADMAGAFCLQVDAGLRQLHVFLDSADPTHTWGGLALIDMDADAGTGNQQNSSSSSAVQGSRKSCTTKGGKGGAAEGAADDMPESVLWVCKGCLTGSKKCGGSPADGGASTTKGAAAGRGRSRSNSGSTAGAASSDEVVRLKEGIRTRDIAVRLLVRELKQAGLAVPALPGDVGWRQLAAAAAGAAAGC